jgi:hypothetical protein
MSIIHSVINDAKEHTTMRSNTLYAPDGMTGAGRPAQHFDDGLVHNHHWAVTTDEAYPSHGRGFVIEISPLQSNSPTTPVHDNHDDGLVHNHHWAVTGQ